MGPGFDVERESDLPCERERAGPDADRKCDVRCASRDGLPAVKAEGDRADRLAACGCDTDLDGVFDRRNGGESRPLAMRAMLTMRGDYNRANWKRVAVKVTALSLILVTTMQFGYGPVQALCTARAQRAIRPQMHGQPSWTMSSCTSCLRCGCVRARVWKNNIKEGDPHGSRAPVVAWGATKISAAYSACATLSGARRDRSWGPRLGQNRWWGGAM